ncbi:DUF1722 domain-containing protein [Gilvimarinus sp. F26214L]|uniref:DUF1722 domain-containing protein n=1 Tax=Gilvimarinus sp. DZF01 TaxID=3461371 RepID=UPI0040461391
MRIWDIDPGYLNRQSLLGEHRELHGIVSIIVNRKRGYARHPETLRWEGHGWALKMRHRQIACEMMLRGYRDRTPVATRSGSGIWPETFIDSPSRQFELLREKYKGKQDGRIPLPATAQQLWSQHKYSALARNQGVYRQIGRDLAESRIDFAELSLLLTRILRQQPTEGGIQNAVQHMWGYVADDAAQADTSVSRWSLQRLLRETQQRAMAGAAPYIKTSTALGELMAWLPAAR